MRTINEGREGLRYDEKGIVCNTIEFKQDDSYYDLSGRKVANGSWMNRPMRKGLYINNGKKVIVR